MSMLSKNSLDFYSLWISFAKSTELWGPYLNANLFMGSSFSFPKNHAIHTDLELLTSDGKKNHYNLWNGRYENCLGNLKFILSKIRTFVGFYKNLLFIFSVSVSKLQMLELKKYIYNFFFDILVDQNPWKVYIGA